jgi:hypothetical protein
MVMSKLRRHLLLLALGAGGLSLVGAGPASAAASGAVADCNSHLRLTRQYTVAQLRKALTTMPADIKEYTNCYDVIQRKLLSQLGAAGGGSGGPGGGSGGSFLPTPVLIVLVLLVLAAGGFAVAAVRRRGDAGGEPAP